MDNRVRIIQLGPVETPNEAYSFEDAFGEFSEAGGRGRARRKQRKLERIENRREVKAARQAARAEKQQARISNRAARQATRQEKRTANAEMRQQRRTMRKGYRDERKGRKDEAGVAEQGLDTGVTADMGNVNGGAPQGGQDMGAQGGGYQDQGGQDQGGGYQDQGGQDQGYSDNVPTGAADDSGAYDADYGSAEEAYDYGSEDSTGGEGDYSDEGDYTGGDDYLGDYSDTDASFDGVMGAEDRYSEFSSNQIDPEIQDTVNKLVWNKELVNRLENERNRVGGDRKQGLSRQIIARKKRMNELQSSLDGYCNADGDFYGADGKRIANSRKAQVGRAYGLANKAMIQRGKPQFTPVAPGLRANISPNRIVVPASSATGINGLDLQADFDAPNAREIKLGVDGSTSSTISWKSVAIGVAVGALAIWAVRKYKLIK